MSYQNASTSPAASTSPPSRTPSGSSAAACSPASRACPTANPATGRTGCSPRRRTSSTTRRSTSSRSTAGGWPRLRPGTGAPTCASPPSTTRTTRSRPTQLFRRARERGELAPESQVPGVDPDAVQRGELLRRVRLAGRGRAGLREAAARQRRRDPGRDPARRTLAIQWDLPDRDATIEGWFPNPYDDFEEIFAATARPASWVHDDVELTFHLCYGDSKFGASPFMGDPPDEEAAARGGTAHLPAGRVGDRRGRQRPVAACAAADRRVPGGHGHDVEPAGALAAAGRISRSNPTPSSTSDWCTPRTAPRVPATARRWRRVPARFGLSTECGLGRHSAEQLDQVADAVAELFGTRAEVLA